MKKNILTYYSILIIAGLLLGGCNPAEKPAVQTSRTPAQIEPATLTVVTHSSFGISKSVLSSFEAENNVKVQFIKGDDAGSALNKVILAKDAPFADVFYGVDNTFLSRALKEGIFEAYASPLLAVIPSAYQLDPQQRALPVDYGDVCLNYDKAYFTDKNISPPQTLEDLLKPEYKDLLVVENPATSSPGLAFLLATIGHFGENSYLDYWRGLVMNNVLVVNDWETAYNSEFSMWGGTHPIVVSYSSSPPFEVINAQTTIVEPPTAVIASDGSCFRQIEFVGILKGTQKRALAEKWIDYMLSVTFQEDMPLQMYVFPVNPNAKLNETFTKFLVVPGKPAEVSPEAIDANREKWIQAWSTVVLH